MPTNQYLPFGTTTGANTLTPAQWAALAARLTGFVDGVADPAQVNTALRQASVIAAMIGQYIADFSGSDAADDGNISVLETNFKAALLGNLQPYFSPPAQIAAFTTAGSYVWTCPPKVISPEIIVLGGGCSGAAGTSSQAGGGGGAGGSSRGHIATSPGVNYNIVVGAGGAAQTTTGSGGLPGGTSSFSTLMSAPGAPSAFTITATGSAGGNAGAGGLLNLPGSSGFDGTPASSSLGGAGGGTMFGSGGRPGTGAGVPGIAYGSGGGGSYGPSNGPSGRGADGCVIIFY